MHFTFAPASPADGSHVPELEQYPCVPGDVEQSAKHDMLEFLRYTSLKYETRMSQSAEDDSAHVAGHVEQALPHVKTAQSSRAAQDALHSPRSRTPS